MGICEDRRRGVAGSTIFNGKVTLLPFQRVWDYKGQCQHIGPYYQSRWGKTILCCIVSDGKLSSIRTLSANSPALMALAEIPSAVPFHNIIGQVNSGPATSGNDGVVAYSSSHLDGAESELIVRYGHETFLHPDAVAEVKRILHAHLESL